MDIYMEYEGIKGSVTAKGYEGMIQLRYFMYGVSRKISMQTGHLSNRENTKPTFKVMTVGKKLDVAGGWGFSGKSSVVQRENASSCILSAPEKINSRNT